MKINELLETRYAFRAEMPDTGIPAAEIRKAIFMVVPSYKQIPARFLKTWKSNNYISPADETLQVRFGIYLVDDPKRYVQLNKSRPVDNQTHRRVRKIVSNAGGLVVIENQELRPTENAERIALAIANKYGLTVGDRIRTMQYEGEQSIQVKLTRL